MQERDAMNCRACGNEERASEGYPCEVCGTFICMICNFRGVSLCARCAADRAAADGPRGAEGAPGMAPDLPGPPA